MFAKKTLVTLSAGALLAAAVPALADHDNWRNRHRAEQRGVVEQYPVAERRVARERLYLPVRSRSDWDSLQNWLQESPETVNRLGFDGSLAVNGWTRRQYDEWVRYDAWDKETRSTNPFAPPLM